MLHLRDCVLLVVVSTFVVGHDAFYLTDSQIQTIYDQWHGNDEWPNCLNITNTKTKIDHGLELINHCADVRRRFDLHFTADGSRKKRNVEDEEHPCPFSIDEYDKILDLCCNSCPLGRKTDKWGCITCECNVLEDAINTVIFDDIVLREDTVKDIRENILDPIDHGRAEQCFEDSSEILSRRKRGATANFKLWTNIKEGNNYVIPYRIHSDYGNQQNDILAIEEAIEEFNEVSCIRVMPLEDYPDAPNWLTFDKGTGCSSPVGRGDSRGENKISLADGCRYKGTIIHEILHSLGFWHEQMRPDRDQYVTVIEQNIRSGLIYNFDKFTKEYIDSMGHAYDYNSVMHYSGYAFSKNGQPTIVRKSDNQAVDAQRVGLSQSDIAQLNQLYKCEITTVTTTTQKPAPTTEAPCADSAKYAASCPSWTARNYCTSEYKTFMSQYCKASCGLCGTGGGSKNNCDENNCDDNAVCTETTESYFCTCKAGYTGNGYNCKQLVNECSSASLNTCHQDAICTDTEDSYTCTCKSGYEGDGRTCRKKSNCDANNCDANAKCTELTNGYYCTCNAGYIGNGLACAKLINECSSSSLNDCHAHATCTDTLNGYRCACKSGYEGDGVTCTEKTVLVNECLNPSLNNCHRLYGICTDEEDGFTCRCKSGYKGDGINCVQNRCSSSLLNDCDVNADCADTAYGYRCTCKEGFDGDGVTCTKKITLTNECYDDNDNDCDENAVCIDTPDSYSCQCRHGFKGDGRTCEPSCSDRRPECREWAARGYCRDDQTTASDEWMNYHCKFSCGRCGCNDYPFTGREAGYCENWKQQGYCTHESYSRYMEKSCTKTCGFCTDMNAEKYVCHDARDVDCSSLSDHCNTSNAAHRGYMERNCKATCKLC